MKRKWGRIVFWLCLLLAMMSLTVASAASVQEQRTETREKVQATLQQLYAKQPKAKEAVARAEGYAVFANTGYKLGIIGSSHGRGMAINNETGEEIFMRMKEYQVGLGLGAKEYAVVFVFGNQDGWHSFVDKGWSFGGQATAAATDNVNGGSLEGSFQVAPNIWMYQLTTKGLAAEIAVKGTNYYRDKKLN